MTEFLERWEAWLRSGLDLPGLAERALVLGPPDCCDATLEAIENPPAGTSWFPCQWFLCQSCGLEYHYTPDDPAGWRWTSDCGCGILDQ